jgi:RNA-binding protein YlmH
MEKEEQFFMKRMNELADMADRQYRPVFTGFLNLSESSMVLSNTEKTGGTNEVSVYKSAPVSVQLWGGYEEAERRLLCFSPPEFVQEREDFPISCIHICPKNRKFSDDLSHRDFLGAVLNLGIDRNRTGDILLKDNDAWLLCETEIAPFIAEHLEKVRHTPVVCQAVPLHEVPPETFFPNVQAVKGFVSALRLDAVIAVAFHASRNSMTDYVRAEKVFVNGRLASENSIKIKENDLISVRGMGKFRFLGTEGESKKGRLAVKIEKYV